MNELNVLRMGLHAYLERFLPHGASFEERERIVKEYRRAYQRQYKRLTRQQFREYTVRFSKRDNKALEDAAKERGMSITKYLQSLLKPEHTPAPSNRMIAVESELIDLMNLVERMEVKGKVRKKLIRRMRGLYATLTG